MRLGVDFADLAPLVKGRTLLTAGLALHIELAGWPRADIWTRQQAAYDLAQARRQLPGDVGLSDEMATPTGCERHRVQT